MSKRLVVLFASMFLFRFILSFIYWHPDVNNHIDWGIRFWEYGPQKFYSANVWNFTWPNQPPGTIYIFAIVRKIFEAKFNFFWWINTHIPPFPSQIMFFLESNLYPALLKLPSIVCDIGIAYLIYKIIRSIKREKNSKLAYLGAFIFLVNPVIWYNSAVWGQTDAVINFFALLSFYLITKKRLVLSILFFTISIYIKASLLIFTPVLFIFALKQKYQAKDWIKAFLVSCLFILLFTAPFSKENPFLTLFAIYKDKVFTQQLHVITANAFNVWAAITGIHEQPDILMLGPLKYRIWGYLLFGISVLIPLYKLHKDKKIKTLFVALSIIAFSSFMLLTNMHERYLYPLFPVFTVWAVLNKKLIPVYWAVSIISLFNLYNFWWYPRLDIIVKAFEYGDRVLPRILGLVMFLLFIFTYKFISKESNKT